MNDVIRSSNEQLIAIEMKPLEGCAAVLVSFNRPFTHVEMNAMHRALNEHLIPHGIETNPVETDAAKWRALRNCARITAVGSAGIGPERVADDYAHVTLNFWTGVPDGDPGPAYAREWLDTFVEKALRPHELKAGEQRHGAAQDFVSFDPQGGVWIDMARYLRSPAGQAQLEALGGKKAVERQPCSHGNATGHCQHCLDAL